MSRHLSLASIIIVTACTASVPMLGGDGGRQDGSGSSSTGCPTVAVDTTQGRWRTAQDPTTCRVHVVSDQDQPALLRGISMTGLETGTRETASGAGFWLFNSATTSESTNAPVV